VYLWSCPLRSSPALCFYPEKWSVCVCVCVCAHVCPSMCAHARRGLSTSPTHISTYETSADAHTHSHTPTQIYTHPPTHTPQHRYIPRHRRTCADRRYSHPKQWGEKERDMPEYLSTLVALLTKQTRPPPIIWTPSIVQQTTLYTS
jgi:hypothetical protein